MNGLSNSSALARRAWLRCYSMLLRGAVTMGPPSPFVALTFDDGPSEEWTPRILDTLDSYQARATFFVLGEMVEKHADVAKEVASRGHEIAVHLFSHDREVADDDERFMFELETTVDLVSGIAGTRPRFIRFPYAHLGRQRPRAIFDRHALLTVHWSFSSMDSRLDANGIRRRVGPRLMPGAIVLLHDGVGSGSKHVKSREATVEALPDVLESCRARGFKPVGLSELLGPKGHG